MVGRVPCPGVGGAGFGRWVLVSAGGGGAGGAGRLLPPPQTFARAAPILIGVASLVLLAQPGPGRELRGRDGERNPLLLAGVFCVAIYVGYFGAAGGILMLAVLTAMMTGPITRANAVKNVIGAMANGVAAVAFAMFGQVDWVAVAPLAAGVFVGGWIGPAPARPLPRPAVGLPGPPSRPGHTARRAHGPPLPANRPQSAGAAARPTAATNLLPER